jgi:hypothetical protein
MAMMYENDADYCQHHTGIKNILVINRETRLKSAPLNSTLLDTKGSLCEYETMDAMMA